MLVARILPTFVLAISLSACAACPKGHHSPQLTSTQAIRIANTAATSRGYQLSRYQRPEAHFEYIANDCTWSVFYELRGPSMPGHFLVIVNDRTQHASISGGM